MKKSVIALVLLSCNSFANEWNFNDDDFNNTGEVVLKTTSGQSVSVDNSGSAQAFSVSNTPSVINTSGSSSGGVPAGLLPLSSKGISYGYPNKSLTYGTTSFPITGDCRINKIIIKQGFTKVTHTLIDNKKNTQYQSLLNGVALVVNGNKDTNILNVGTWEHNNWGRELVSNGVYFIPKGATFIVSSRSNCPRNTQNPHVKVTYTCLNSVDISCQASGWD